MYLVFADFAGALAAGGRRQMMGNFGPLGLSLSIRSA